MLKLVMFRNIRWFPIVTILAYYLVQGFAGLLVFSKEAQPKIFLLLLMVAIIGYWVGAYFLLNPISTKKIINNHKRVKFNTSNLAIVLFAFYFLMMLYVAITAKEIALFSALHGASVEDLSRSREELLRSRTGWQASIKYFYSIFNYFVIPYCIVMLFSIKHRLRFIILGIFLFTLLLTLEKSITLMALLPLVVFYLNKKSRKQSLAAMLVLVLSIGGASFLSRGGLASVGGDSPSAMEVVPTGYNVFNSQLQVLYLVNRIVWIPYVTALDWLRYQDQVLKGELNLGRSIGIISYLTGRPYINMEREVFAFEWGQNETGTGSANTAYFIDGYMNFGYLGVFFYSMVLGVIVRLIHLSDNIPCKCVSYIPLFYLASNSLSAVLFSGGLFLLLLTIVFVKAPGVEGGYHA